MAERRGCDDLSDCQENCYCLPAEVVVGPDEEDDEDDDEGSVCDDDDCISEPNLEPPIFEDVCDYPGYDSTMTCETGTVVSYDGYYWSMACDAGRNFMSGLRTAANLGSMQECLDDYSGNEVVGFGRDSFDDAYVCLVDEENSFTPRARGLKSRRMTKRYADGGSRYDYMLRFYPQNCQVA